MRAGRSLAALAMGLASIAAAAATLAGGTGTDARHPKLPSHAGSRCLDCHRQLLQDRKAHPPAGTGCPGCHLVANTADATLVTLSDRQPALCLGCHPGVQAAVDRASLRGHGHSCLTCHDPHASAHEHLLVAAAGELCQRCHQRSRLGRSHAEAPVAARPCSGCHVAHETVARQVPETLAARAGLPPPDSVTTLWEATPPPPPVVEVAPVLPAPAAAPAPTPRPTPVPLSAEPPRLPATPGWAEARSLLRERRLAEAATAFSALVGADTRTHTIQLLVACESATVERAVASVSPTELFVVPTTYQGRSCFAIGWGLYASAEEARAALDRVPPYFRERGARPAVAGKARLTRSPGAPR